MLSTLDNIKPLTIQTNCLWFLTLAFSIIIVLSNWFDARLINFFGVITDAGTLVFPLTFLLSNLITEVYGYKFARRAIWCGFISNLFFIVYGQIIIHLPSPDYPTNNAIFDSLLTVNSRIICASAISYFLAEPLNSFIIAKLKIKMHGKKMGLRFILSTVIASGVDSIVFTFLAFYGIIHLNNLISLSVSMWFIKISIEILGLPISVYLAKKLKANDHIDVYDQKTSFNIFKLDTIYSNQDNFFVKR